MAVLQNLIDELNSTFGTINLMAFNDSNNASILMSQLFCGRSAQVFQVTPDSVNMFDQAEKAEGPQIFKSKTDNNDYVNDNSTSMYCVLHS